MPHPGTITTAPGVGIPENDWGVRVFALHDNNRTNAPQSYHGISIAAGLDDSGGLSGGTTAPVGRVTSWNPQNYARDVVHTYELSAGTAGKAVDITPGRNTQYTVSMTRVELWEQELEVALGLTDADEVFEDLVDQDRPFRSDEVLMRATTLYRHWVYRGCWLTQMSFNGWESEGSDLRMVRTGEFMFVRRSRVT